MSFLLPPTIALKSSHFNAYLNYSDESPFSATYGLLQVNGGNIFSPLAKFEVVTANTGTGLVHIRCAHNKKFLRWINNRFGYLSPEADEPEENPSIWSCTLFEPQVAEDGDPKKFLLFHVQSNQYARGITIDGATHLSTERSWSDASTFYITDLESLVILPKHVAFKADNDRYLQRADSNQLRFISTDKAIPDSWFEVDTDGNGNVRIKLYNGNHLRLGGGSFGNAIFADGNSNGFPAPTLFSPVKVDAITVALKCLDNNRFCTRHTGFIENGLSANETSTSISNPARFRLEELVLSRRIYNANYDLANAVIYGETPITMATANASNNTSADNTVEFKFAYTESKSSTWSSSHSWTVGVSVSVSVSIPFGLGGVENTYYGEYNGSYEWGETITTENTLETTYTASVPANTSISVSLMATKGYCDVPYSYYQRDVLYNGQTAVYKKDDGLYTGINSYNFHYVVTTLSLRDSQTRADLSTTEQKLPDPSADPSREEIVPIPPAGSSSTFGSSVQNKLRTKS